MLYHSKEMYWPTAYSNGFVPPPDREAGSPDCACLSGMCTGMIKSKPCMGYKARLCVTHIFTTVNKAEIVFCPRCILEGFPNLKDNLVLALAMGDSASDTARLNYWSTHACQCVTACSNKKSGAPFNSNGRAYDHLDNDFSSVRGMRQVLADYRTRYGRYPDAILLDYFFMQQNAWLWQALGLTRYLCLVHVWCKSVYFANRPQWRYAGYTSGCMEQLLL